MLSIRKQKYKPQEYSSLAGECFFSTNPFSVPGSLPLYTHNDYLSDFNIKLRKDLFPELYNALGATSSIDSNYFKLTGATGRFLAPHQATPNTLQSSDGIVAHNHSGYLSPATFADGHTLNRSVFVAGGGSSIGWGTGSSTTIYVESNRPHVTNAGGSHYHSVSFSTDGESENAPPHMTCPLFIHTGKSSSDIAVLIVPSSTTSSYTPTTFALDTTSLGNFVPLTGPAYSVFDCSSFCAQYNIHSFVAKFPLCNASNNRFVSNIELIKTQIVELQKFYKYVYVIGLTEGALLAAHAVNGLTKDVDGLITINGIFNLTTLPSVWLTNGISNALGTNYASLLSTYSVSSVKCPLLTMSLCYAMDSANMDTQSSYIASNNLSRVAITGQNTGNPWTAVVSNTHTTLNGLGLYQPNFGYKFISDYSASNIPSSVLKFMNLLV